MARPTGNGQKFCMIYIFQRLSVVSQLLNIKIVTTIVPSIVSYFFHIEDTCSFIETNNAMRPISAAKLLACRGLSPCQILPPAAGKTGELSFAFE
jgi:hypothetical protein